MKCNAISVNCHIALTTNIMHNFLVPVWIKDSRTPGVMSSYVDYKLSAKYTDIQRACQKHTFKCQN